MVTHTHTHTHTPLAALWSESTLVVLWSVSINGGGRLFTGEFTFILLDLWRRQRAARLLQRYKNKQFNSWYSQQLHFIAPINVSNWITDSFVFSPPWFFCYYSQKKMWTWNKMILKMRFIKIFSLMSRLVLVTFAPETFTRLRLKVQAVTSWICTVAETTWTE